VVSSSRKSILPRNTRAALLVALVATVLPAAARGQDAAPAPAIEEVARDLLVAPPTMPPEVEVAMGRRAISPPLPEVGRLREAPAQRWPTSLREIFGDDLDEISVLHQPRRGVFSTELPAYLAPDTVLFNGAPRSAGERPGPSGPSGYSLGENLRASLIYSHARAFPLASSEALRKERYLDLSTDRDRDVLGLKMAWSWQDSTLAFGYRLESSRGVLGEGRTLNSLVAGEGVDHTLTIGITRRWGGAGD